MSLRSYLPFRRCLLGLLSLILSSGPALACSCAPNSPPLKAFTDADFVFRGRVTSTVDGLLRVAVDDSYKGSLNAEVQLRAGGGSCVMLIERDTPYLFYAFKSSGEEEVIWTGPCTRTKPVTLAQEDLLFLEARRKGRVSIQSSHRRSPQALEISWTSRLASDYRIESSVNLHEWNEVAVVSGKESQTTYTDQRDLPPQLYYRIVELAADP